MVGAFSAWDRMTPRTVYEKAVQDFTETAQQLARLNQLFRHASFAEFEMLMGLEHPSSATARVEAALLTAALESRR